MPERSVLVCRHCTAEKLHNLTSFLCTSQCFRNMLYFESIFKSLVLKLWVQHWSCVFVTAADIYDKVAEELEKGGHLDCECIGGGRIKHDCQSKKIHVYGYSMVRECRIVLLFQWNSYVYWLGFLIMHGWYYISWGSLFLSSQVILSIALLFFAGLWQSKSRCFHRETEGALS